MSIKRNTFFNLIGAFTPILMALVTVPFYLRIIGEARYGILALIWIFTGYFGLFEMGMGRATAYYISKIRSSESPESEKIYWTATCLNGFLGSVGAILFFFIAQFCLSRFFNIPKEFILEVEAALPWIALTIPISTVASVGQGVLQGRERFLALNSWGVLTSILNQSAPLLAAYFIGQELKILVAAIVFVRLIGMGFLFGMIRCYLPILHLPRFSLSKVRSLISFGGWVSVSSIVGTLIITLDRLLIGGIAGPVALTLYTIPVNLTQQFSLLASSLASALFPRYAGQSANDRLILAQRAIRAVASLLTPCIVIGIFCMEPFLSIWVGKEISQNSSPIGVIILIGVWFNSLALIPFGLLHGSGAPRSTALLHICELPVFICGLYFITVHFGIIGAVIVTVARFVVDAIALVLLAKMRLSRFGFLIPNIAILLFSQAASLILNAFSVFRILAVVALCILLSFMGLKYSVDFTKIVCNIVKSLRLRRGSSEHVSKV